MIFPDRVTNPPVVKLVTKVNGVSALLFHVEHFKGVEWYWRWRIVSGYPAAYLKWREGSSLDPRVLIHPEAAGCVIEAEWRADLAHPWSQATLHECAVGTAQFRVKALEDFDSESGFRALSAMPCDMVAAWLFGPLELAAGVETVIQGTADGPFPDSVLLSSGEFRPVSDVLEIENITPSSGSFVGVVKESRLSAVPGCAGRRFFALSHSPAVTPDLQADV